MTANEDFLFTQEAMALGLVTEAQVQEAFALQKRMADDLELDERVSVILVKRGYMGEDQARRVFGVTDGSGAAGKIRPFDTFVVPTETALTPCQVFHRFPPVVSATRRSALRK